MFVFSLSAEAVGTLSEPEGDGLVVVVRKKGELVVFVDKMWPNFSSRILN